MPKVSIVLPIYNGQKYIRKSIESIIGQTFEDWELIVVNDCSTDNTEEIVKNYIKKDSRIKLVSNSVNQKLPNSLNIGFQYAKGNYLTWTSDDNIYLPNAIDKMVRYLDKNNNAYMVCAGMEYIDENDTPIGKHVKYDNTNMLLNNVLGACFMYRKKVMEIIGGYDASQFLVEDYDYWLRILFRFGSIHYIDECLYLYRKHNESLSITKKKEVHEMLLKLRMRNIDVLLRYLENNKSLLCSIYYDFRNNNYLSSEMKNKFIQMVPELHIDKDEILRNEKIIIYGAGNMGKEAYNKYGNDICYYIDQDERKVGSRLNGIEVKSSKDLVNLSNKYRVVIATGLNNIYEFLEIIKKLGLVCSGVYTDYDANRKKG